MTGSLMDQSLDDYATRKNAVFHISQSLITVIFFRNSIAEKVHSIRWHSVVLYKDIQEVSSNIQCFVGHHLTHPMHTISVDKRIIADCRDYLRTKPA